MKLVKFAIIILFMSPLLAKAEETKYLKEISLAEKYLNTITSLRADFRQISPEGEVSVGKLYVSKPGKLKIDYLSPSLLTILLNNKRVTYFDKELDEVTRTSFDSIILSFLTKKDISFARDGVIREVTKEKDLFTIMVEDPNEEEQQTLGLVFDSKISVLKEMQVIDQDKKITQITLSDIKTNIVLDKKTFVLDREFLKR